MKKILILILIFISQNVFATDYLNNLFNSDITIKTSNYEEKQEKNNSNELKTYKSAEERGIYLYTDPDIFREKYQNNINNYRRDDILPSWVKTRKSNKTELYIVCQLYSGEFKAVNILNENGFIYPEINKNIKNNYYSYFGNSSVKYIYTGNGVYERVKQCDFSILD